MDALVRVETIYGSLFKLCSMSFTSIVQICLCPFWEAFLICPLLSSIPVCQTCLPLCCLPAYVILQQKEKGIFPFCVLSGQWWKHDEMSVRKLHARTHTHTSLTHLTLSSTLPIQIHTYIHSRVNVFTALHCTNDCYCATHENSPMKRNM